MSDYAEEDLDFLAPAPGKTMIWRDLARKFSTESDSYRRALEDIALLDEADGHELTAVHAHRAVARATKALGKHPSEIFAERNKS